RTPVRLRMAVHHATIAWKATRLSQRFPADIYHVVDGSHGYIARFLPKSRTMVTSHDIIPKLQAAREFPLPPPGMVARWIIDSSLRGIAESIQVISDSQSTRN